MTLLERRRMLMGRKAEPEQWDYILLPNEDGLIPSMELSVIAGQTFTIIWNKGNWPQPVGSTHYLFRMFNAKLEHYGQYSFVAIGNIQKSGRIQETVTGSGRMVISGWGGNGTTGNSFAGDYIKVRIE